MFIRLQNLEKENDKLVEQLRNGSTGKNFFTGIMNKITKSEGKPEQAVNLRNIKAVQKPEEVLKEEPSTEFTSKTLDKIKQKKLDKKSKKLASDNIDYEPVFK
jgi:hypothetical protein